MPTMAFAPRVRANPSVTGLQTTVAVYVPSRVRVGGVPVPRVWVSPPVREAMLASTFVLQTVAAGAGDAASAASPASIAPTAANRDPDRPERSLAPPPLFLRATVPGRAFPLCSLCSSCPWSVSPVMECFRFGQSTDFPVRLNGPDRGNRKKSATVTFPQHDTTLRPDRLPLLIQPIPAGSLRAVRNHSIPLTLPDTGTFPHPRFG